MKQLERRVQKVEELIRMKYARPDSFHGDLTSEEAEKIVRESLNSPRKALFVQTREGFVDVYHLPEEEKARVCNAYSQMEIELYTLDELQDMGFAPWEGENDEIQ